MAARVETKFTGDTRDIERKLAQLDSRMDKFAQKSAASMNRVQSSVGQLDRTTANLGKTLSTMATTFAAAFSAREAIRLADTFTQFEAKLINANVAASDMAKTQEKLFAIAKANGSEIVALADLYGAMSMSAQSLGLSQADIMKATEGVSAAMRVSGATTAQASATILQLGQALAGGTVRAEEYNSMLENSPALVRAVADASTKYAGDLGKLRTAINDGKVSSEEWAQSILAASDMLVAKAAKAPLTVAASIQNLQTSLVQYVGQADQSLGATEKLAFALKLLGENIGTVAGAIAILGAVVVSRGIGSMAAYTGTLIANQVASARLVMFQTAMTASMTGVSRSALMATTAMTGLNAAMSFLGGPIGIAITAIAVAVMGLASAAKTAQRETGEFTDAMTESNRVMNEAAKINANVADMTKAFGEKSSNAVNGVLGLCDATGKLADETFRLADAQQEAARTAILDRVAKNRVEIAERENPGFWTKAGEAAGMTYTSGPNRGRRAADVRREEAETLKAQNVQLMGAAIQIGLAPGARWTNAPRTGSGGGTGTKPDKKSKGSGSSGPSAADVKRNSAELGRQYEREIAQIETDLLNTAEARHTLALQRLDWERDDAKRAVERQLADKQITDAAATTAKKAIQTAYAKSVELENANRVREIEEARIQSMAEQAQYEDNIARILDSTARNRADIADTLAERNAIERAAFEAYQVAEKAAFDARQAETRARLRLAKKLDEEAERKLTTEASAFGDFQTSERGAYDKKERQTNPFAKHIDAAKDVQTSVLNSLSDGLGDFEDGLVNAIMQTEKLGDVFKNVAKNIIADLARIAIQKAIIGPLANMMGLGDGGFLTTMLGGAKAPIKNAIGTNYSPGGLTLVGESGPELVNMTRGAGVLTNDTVRKLANQNRSISRGAPVYNFHTTVHANDAVMAGQIREDIAKANVVAIQQARQLSAQDMMETQQRSTRR